ncbi:MAG: sigma-70 family RNA polymerase sigma factor [Planctomycetes bacterium]|nr:sigma-70 family RNA polymerase sigma factor [Planctomycetota bacterium]
MKKVNEPKQPSGSGAPPTFSFIGPGEQSRLIERVLAGDSEAYRPLVEHYQRMVFSLAARMLGKNYTEAEDITQDTFVRAFEYLNSLEDRSRFGPWLFQIVRSLCRDRLRRLETERRALENFSETWLKRQRFQAAPAEEEVRSILSQLPPDEYQALKMRYYENCTYDEIAARMQLTFSQVDHLIRKARARLEQKISQKNLAEKNRERVL